METTETKKQWNTHHGHAIKRIRRDKGLSQKNLAQLINMAQQTVGRYEEQEKIDDEILERFANGLDVSVDLIKELEDNKPLTYYIENNTFSNKDNSIGINVGESTTINHPAEKAFYTSLEQMQKLYDNSIQLYNQLLTSTQEKIAILEKKISEAEK